MPTTALSPQEAAEQLPKDLQISLGLLCGADSDVIGYTLGSFPVGTRSTLLAYEVVHQLGARWRFTRFGSSVVVECRRRRSSHIEFLERGLKKARLRREAAKLPEDLQETLALLTAVSDDDAESFIALAPRRDKIRLAEHGIIDADFGLPLDEPVPLVLTDRARGIMEACRYLQLPEAEKQKLREFEQARREYFESLS